MYRLHMSLKKDSDENILDTLSITIDSNNLTFNQKLILKKIYEKMRHEIESLIQIINNKDNTSEIVQIILRIVCICIKYIEKVKIKGKPIKGEEKKLISLELGRIVIKNEIKDDEIKDVILSTYEISAEPVLEGIIDVSREVNTLVKKNLKKLLLCCK